jgi:hypothetical protein
VTRADRTWQALGLSLLWLLLGYPGLFFGRVLALQAPLWGVPPWSDLGGPNPMERAHLQEAATTLAPRLALVQRHGWALALWNPFVGGGRVGFLAMGAEGYAPLPVAAALLARKLYLGNVLLLLHTGLAFFGVYLLARRFLSPAAATLSGLTYALSGPVASSWCTASGSAAALGPWLWWAALAGSRPVGALAFALAMASGGESWGFVAGFVALALVSPLAASLQRRASQLALVLVSGLGLAAPSLALAVLGAETPGLWWLAGNPQSPPAFASLFFAPAEPPRNAPWVFLGAPVLVLALLGCLLPGKLRRVGLVTVLASGLLVLAPTAALPPFLAAHRPGSTLACGVALLAGAGVELLLARAGSVPKAAILALAFAAPVARLLPAAAVWLPWETRERATLPSPEAPAAPAAHQPVLPLLTLPPDTPALLGLADARAKTFFGEPRYRGLLAPGAGGVVPFSRITDRKLAELGVTWLWEPQEVAVVSGELFARLEPATARRDPSTPTYPLAVPGKATRLGLRVGHAPLFAFLEQSGRRFLLAEDRALAGESELWHFFLLPRDVPEGPARLVTDRQFAARHPELALGWDTSGWELAGEGGGVRLWRARHALPLASCDAPHPGDPPPQLLRWEPQGAVIEVETAQAQELVVRLKFRPHLLRVLLDGKPHRSHRAGEVWTAVPVPPGRHRVELRYALPGVLWVLPALALLVLLPRRKERP